MKKCIRCNLINEDENVYCYSCGSTNFVQITDKSVYNTQRQSMPNNPSLQPYIKPEKAPFTAYDVATILSFVLSLIGLFVTWVVLEPLAFFTAIIGFFRGNRYKPLAAAGFVIAVLGFIIRLFITLYQNDIIGKWVINGILGW